MHFRSKRFIIYSIGLGGATSLNAGLVTAPIHWQDPAKQFMAKYSMDLYADLAESFNFSTLFLVSSLYHLILLQMKSVLCTQGIVVAVGFI